MAASVASTTGTGESSRTEPGDTAPVEPQPQPRASKSQAEWARTGGASAERSYRRGRLAQADLNGGEVAAVFGSLPQAGSIKIALPTSDTPIIDRNQNMRKEGNRNNRNRRSSLGSRGRRARSLVEIGEMAIPHPEVGAAEFYKHIAADLPEPRRLKQLLMWCGERALSAKHPHGKANADAIRRAREIQDQILKDFASRSEFSDWFSRDDDAPRTKVVLKPNPRNFEMDNRLASLEENIDRLRREKKAWLSMRKMPPEQPPLFGPDESGQTVLPVADLLGGVDRKIRAAFEAGAISSRALRLRTESTLRKISSALQFQIDLLADNVHKLDQRVMVGSKEADRILMLASKRLQEREQRERVSAGTSNMPLIEVLRALGRTCPKDNVRSDSCLPELADTHPYQQCVHDHFT
ncbi:hypothetical protein PLIIFM63780_010620 [Purpureocillium lilacinum]|nr:hypothetical protein PLIIFM63780_010620 [Purpureocillium lilacinum]